jgi:hypothetical protein
MRCITSEDKYRKQKSEGKEENSKLIWEIEQTKGLNPGPLLETKN